MKKTLFVLLGIVFLASSPFLVSCKKQEAPEKAATGGYGEKAEEAGGYGEKAEEAVGYGKEKAAETGGYGEQTSGYGEEKGETGGYK
jgi:hypothetical protein